VDFKISFYSDKSFARSTINEPILMIFLEHPKCMRLVIINMSEPRMNVKLLKWKFYNALGIKYIHIYSHEEFLYNSLKLKEQVCNQQLVVELIATNLTKVCRGISI